MQLEKLDLYEIKQIDERISLNLPNLMVICIDCVESTLVIDSNKLRKIKFFGLFGDDKNYGLEIVKFNTVDYIELSELNDRLYENLIKLINLRSILIEDFNSFLMRHDFLHHFKQLKEIQFMNSHEFYTKLLKQKQFYKLDTLRIYFLGLNLDGLEWYSDFLDQNDDYYVLDEKKFRFFHKNYTNLADRLPFISEIIYDEIKIHQMPDNFFRKLTNLYALTISDRIRDESSFFELVKKLDGFPTLTLNNCFLSQNFLEQLSTDCWFIQTLILDQNFCESIDFEILKPILMNFNCLHTLIIKPNINLRIAKQIYDHSKMLSYFSFYSNGKLKMYRKTNELKI